MNTPSLRSRLLVLAVALAASPAALAQRRDGRDAYLKDPRTAIVKEATARSNRLIAQARQRLRERKLQEAERLAWDAILLCEDVSTSNSEAHGILAETYLLQGKPDRAVAELSLTEGVGSDRYVFTKAIALTRLGKGPAAREILVDSAGDAGEGGGRLTPFRRGVDRLRLPMDGDNSLAALAATGYLLRADAWSSQICPEVLEDLREAGRLAPTCAAIHLVLSNQLADRDLLDEALVEIRRASALDGPNPVAGITLRIEMIQARIFARDKAKSGG